MSQHTPHELAEEFPDHVEKLQAMKAASPQFAALMDKYHEVNRMIHRAETDLEPTDDAHMEDLRKERLRLKDAVAAGLRTG
ncbi:MAG: DUF465 domain-containing protein [Limimaricola sp.]|uniref:YdcH family protein n=1 Tax=Limimaricola sp. TaxID=2211665 RepID=UPI001DFF2A91|nr:YdcH family protein [Limimaricola sp.]MBI1416344.1 DUF465 domain-containing protein [Limimaricola sp.]